MSLEGAFFYTSHKHITVEEVQMLTKNLMDDPVASQVQAYAYSLQDARDVWMRYEDLVRQSFRELRLVASSYRAGAITSTPPLSAHVPLLLAEPFGLTSADMRHQVALENLCLDHFTQVLDDATDSGRGKSAYQLHLSHHLLAKGMCLYLSLSTHPQTFTGRLENYFEEAMGAERFLWKHHGKVVPYEDLDFTVLGHRCALVKAI